MKNIVRNILLMINAMLLIAVIFLFVFYDNIQNELRARYPMSRNNLTQPKDKSTESIAYFNMDTLEDDFIYFRNLRDELHNKEYTNDSLINSLKDKLKEDYLKFENGAPMMSQVQITEAQDKLVRQDRYIQKLANKQAQELSEESVNKLQDVQDKINSFFKQYNANKDYNYIIATSAHDFIYYKDTAYDITKDLVNGLNLLYSKK